MLEIAQCPSFTVLFFGFFEAKPWEVAKREPVPCHLLIPFLVNRANGKVDGQSCLLKLKSQQPDIVLVACARDTGS